MAGGPVRTRSGRTVRKPKPHFENDDKLAIVAPRATQRITLCDVNNAAGNEDKVIPAMTAAVEDIENSELRDAPQCENNYVEILAKHRVPLNGPGHAAAHPSAVGTSPHSAVKAVRDDAGPGVYKVEARKVGLGNKEVVTLLAGAIIDIPPGTLGSPISAKKANELRVTEEGCIKDDGSIHEISVLVQKHLGQVQKEWQELLDERRATEARGKQAKDEYKRFQDERRLFQDERRRMQDERQRIQDDCMRMQDEMDRLREDLKRALEVADVLQGGREESSGRKGKRIRSE